MQTGTITSQFTVGGISFSGAISKQAEGGISHVVALPAGIAGAIMTAGAGVDGLVTGHGISVSDVVDVHWADPSDGTHKVRRGLTVDTANANDIAFDETPAGEGDAIPAEDTACFVDVQIVVASTFDGDLVIILAVKSTQQAMVDLRDAAGSELALKLAADEVYSWVSGQGFTNPIAADDITEIRLSNGSATASTVYIGILHDSVT